MIEDANLLLEEKAISKGNKRIILAYKKLCEKNPIFNATTNIEVGLTDFISVKYDSPLDDIEFSINFFIYENSCNMDVLVSGDIQDTFVVSKYTDLEKCILNIYNTTLKKIKGN